MSSINENEIAEYLDQNPDFFKSHSGLLASLYLPNPHGGGTVSLAERQQVAQRDKIRQIEQKYSELLKFGTENDEISTKVHKLTLALLKAKNFNSTVQALSDSLQNEFSVPFVSLHLWATAENVIDTQHASFNAVDESIKTWAASLTEPYCGNSLNETITILAGVEAKSYAIAALGDGEVTGILIMASDNEKRFYAEMGTVFVKRIGELITAALQKYLVQ